MTKKRSVVFRRAFSIFLLQTITRRVIKYNVPINSSLDDKETRLPQAHEFICELGKHYSQVA